MSESYQGKAKTLVRLSPDTFAMTFRDDVTAFEGQKKASFPGKGAVASAITEMAFAMLAAAGTRHHVLGRRDAQTLDVRALDMVPLEVVVRFVVAGSLSKRLGWASGTPLPHPIVEFYYKRDDLGDPLLTDEHLDVLGILPARDREVLRALGLDVAQRLRDWFGRVQLDLWDLKLEYGRDAEGFVLADEISPDNCRLRDSEHGIIYDKDRFRRDLGDLLEGYRVVLDRLRTLRTS